MRPIGLSPPVCARARARPPILPPSNVCWQCCRHLRRLAATPRPRPRPRLFSNASLPRATASPATISFTSPVVKAGYFSSNTISDRSNAPRSTSTQPLPPPPQPPQPIAFNAPACAPDGQDGADDALARLPPHRRRQAARRAANALPQNASDMLTSVAAAQPAHSLRRHLSALLSLSKPRLTVLVVLTAMVPYALYPVPAFLSPLAETPSLSPLTLLFLTTGTTLCSASANALNMLYEPATDAKMSRTRNRPLVRHLLSTRTAVLFALGCGALGTAGLYWGVNPTVAFLGAANIALYAGAYTPLKRRSCLNTWVGALVGAIPPLMGWAAAAGESATADGTFRELLFAADGSSAGGWLLAALLFAWQFPHFMALSWTIRDEYRRAGLRMLAWVDPARNARVALRYSLAFVPICAGLCAVGVTEWAFALTSLPANWWLAREAWRFHSHEGHKGSARGLFWASVWHLPAVMGLALLQKKGMWQRIWKTVAGEPDDDDDDDDDEWEDVEDLVEDHVDMTDIPGIPAPVPVPVATRSSQQSQTRFS